MGKRAVLVTGGAGYIGSHVVTKFVKENFEVVCLDNLSRSKKFIDTGSINIKGEISDRDLLDDIFSKFKFDAVVHLAAFAYVGESVEVPQEYYFNNVADSLELFRTMIKSNIRNLVFTSSCASYGISEYLPIDENHPQNPINPYGKSKLYIEQILKDYKIPYEFSTICFRLFNVAGCGSNSLLQESHDPETHLIPLVLKHAYDKKKKILTKEIPIYGSDHETFDGTPVRDFIHVDDLAEAFYLGVIKLADSKKATFSTYNLSNEKGFSVKEIIKIVEVVSKEKIDFVVSSKREGDPAVLVGASGKAKSELGWQPKRSSLEDIIRSAWDALNN